MTQRRTTIDAIRGFCLVNIFVNHIADGQLARFSPSRLGFSDSSDIFVLLSGISTALALGRTPHRTLPETIRLLWRRAGRLYAVNVGIVLASFAFLLLILALRGLDGPSASETRLLRDHGPLTLLLHGLMLWQTIGYSCVLRLYVVLMLLAPFLVRLADWRCWAPLPPAILVWLLAGQFDMVVNNSLSGDPFALTILPWTLLFAIGIAIGQGLNRGLALPGNRALEGLALAYVAAYLVFTVVVLRVWPAAQDWFATRNDHFWLGASKTYQSPLRLLHVLALAYLVLALREAPVVRLLHRVPRDHVLVRLGRHSLPVFALGAIGALLVGEGLDLAVPLFGQAWLPLLVLEIAATGLYVGLALRFDAPPRRLMARAGGIAQAR